MYSRRMATEYGSATADFLGGLNIDVALVATVLAAVAAVLGAVAGWRALSRRRLHISVTTTPLIATEAHRIPNMRITLEKRAVDHPFATTIKIANTGQHDVETVHFDQARPVRVDLAVPVIQLIQAPDRGIRCSIDGHAVLIGPDLMSRGSVTEIKVVTEGRPALTNISHHLANTRVKWRSPRRGSAD
jgi:hypothetical protein